MDAWVIWDPFFAAAQKQIGARVLVDGKGLVANHQFYLAARDWARNNAALQQVLLEEIARVDDWGRDNAREVSAILAAQTGLDPAVVELAASRYSYGVKPVSNDVLREQQKIADAFASLKLIPKPIAIKDAVLASAK